MRVGIHAGEVEVRGADVAGMAVHIGARVAAHAGPSEVYVSSTVREIVTGSRRAFVDRGEYELKGVPGIWRLYRVARDDADGSAVSDTEQATREPAERTLFGHPIGLANLFGVELWERFSFYGMLTILGYYLYYSVTEGGLGLPKSTATGIVGAYGGLVYLSTVLGGWIADRVLGMERTVLYGGVVVMAGHIALALVPGLPGVGVGLVLVALGSGALKANASSLLGTLYEKGDPRADGGFTLFYLGINLGAFIGPLITGLLQTHVGFHYGFGAAAIGMAAGLAQYVVFRRNLGTHGRDVPNPLPHSAIGKVVGLRRRGRSW